MPQLAVQRLFELTRDRDPIITTEVGQHQMWAAQYFGFDEPNKWLTAAGSARWAMACPPRSARSSAIPDALVIDIAGEASIQMNIQEMGTASQYPPAGQGVHPQQRIHGHGPPVAGADLREPLFELAIRTACPIS